MSKILNAAGTFPATVTAVDLGESSTGKPFVRLDFETEEGEISAWKYCSDAALPYTLRDFEEAFGFDGDFENLDQIKDKPCVIVTDFETDDKGKDRLRVKFINAPGSGKAASLDADKKKSIAQMLSEKARVKKTGGEEVPF